MSEIEIDETIEIEDGKTYVFFFNDLKYTQEEFASAFKTVKESITNTGCTAKILGLLGSVRCSTIDKLIHELQTIKKKMEEETHG